MLVPAFAVTVWFSWKEIRNLPQEPDVLNLLNEQISELEFSSAVLLEENQSALAKLQRRRIFEDFLGAGNRIKYPVIWSDLLYGVLVLLMVFLLAILIPSQNGSTQSPAKTDPVSKEAVVSIQQEDDSVYIAAMHIRVQPPTYTGLASWTVDEWDAEVPEASMLTWKLEMVGNPQAVWMLLNQRDSVPLSLNGDQWEMRKKAEDLIYSLHFIDAKAKRVSSPFYNILVAEDQEPVVSIKGVPQFQRLDYAPNISVPLTINMSDDYGLKDGYLVATVTKGSGESVKFREQKIPFQRKVDGKEYKVNLELNTRDFDLEPGNELYFYAYAEDNKRPTSQSARTETHFFILNDTSEVAFSLQGSLGVDLMPDYFRSQLQIIIDTRKLIEEQPELNEYEFNSRSNALGFDQKSLRLKYGQFIGEEEDSGLEVDRETPEGEEGHDHADHEEPDPAGENVVMTFGHDTDGENEEGEWMDRGTEHEHGHDHEERLDPESEEDPLEGFLHNHEDEETATFYSQSLKSKLRAALTQMWDAELYLRLYEPEKSLPYQLEAQELLKEIRNHARIYVQRIGFDPPTVNEDETRLTGKLDKLNRRNFNQEVKEDRRREVILAGIKVLEQLMLGESFNAPKRKRLEYLGSEISQMALESPGDYLLILNRLRRVVNDFPKHKEGDLQQLSLLLSGLLSEEDKSLSSYTTSSDQYAADFLNQLINSSPQ